MPVALERDEFIKRANERHKNKYDYSKVVFNGMRDKREIICPIHGGFVQLLASHLNGSGCPKCAGSVKKTRDIFESDSRKIHGDKYDYSKFKYVNNKIKSLLICRECGNEFEIRPDAHLNGKGCSICGYKKAAKSRSKSLESFIEHAQKIHGLKYDYSSSKYINSLTKLDILCRIHGYFSQTPGNHLSGAGCPSCMNSSGEDSICKILNELNISFKREYSFDNCIHKSKMFFDFYLPDHNVCIEYDGEQHFIPIEFFGGEESLISTKERDILKMKYCKENNIFILRISYLDKDRIYFILKNFFI